MVITKYSYCKLQRIITVNIMYKYFLLISKLFLYSYKNQYSKGFEQISINTFFD